MFANTNQEFTSADISKIYWINQDSDILIRINLDADAFAKIDITLVGIGSEAQLNATDFIL